MKSYKTLRYELSAYDSMRDSINSKGSDGSPRTLEVKPRRVTDLVRYAKRKGGSVLRAAGGGGESGEQRADEFVQGLVLGGVVQNSGNSRKQEKGIPKSRLDAYLQGREITRRDARRIAGSIFKPNR